MSGVTFQYGRKTTNSIESLNTGVALSSYSWPTITFISSAFCPLSNAVRWNAGTFTKMYRCPSERGSQR